MSDELRFDVDGEDAGRAVAVALFNSELHFSCEPLQECFRFTVFLPQMVGIDVNEVMQLVAETVARFQPGWADSVRAKSGY